MSHIIFGKRELQRQPTERKKIFVLSFFFSVGANYPKKLLWIFVYRFFV